MQTNKIRMALTFDDGPNTVTTPKVLDILEQYHVKASFFLIGQNITNEAKKIIKRQLTAGCTIECHSWTHSDMTKFTKEQIQDEINRTNALITECTGGIKPEFFRPPYISLNDLMYDSIPMPFICGQGVTDWEDKVTAKERADGVIKAACDGEIILLHDMLGNDNTVEALKTIIPTLQGKGVEFYTIRDLFKECKINPMQHHKIWTNLYN